MTTATDNPDTDLRAAITRLRGYWHPFHQGLLDMSPDYLAAYLDYQHAPARAGRLEPKVCEFVYIAADIAVNHLYASGAARHVGMALDKGASAAEVLEVIQLAVLACHDTFETGLPVLLEEMAARGMAAPGPLTPEDQAAKEQYVSRVGRWPDGADALFRLAPDFVRAFLSYAEIPYGSGPLPRKVKAFIGIAIHASPAGPRSKPLRHHVGAALDAGATPEEIVDVLQLSSAIAIHSCTIGVPALAEAVAQRTAPR